MITEKETKVSNNQASKESPLKKPPKPPLPSRPKNASLPKIKANEKTELNGQSKELQKTDPLVDITKTSNAIVTKQGPTKPPPPKIHSPRNSVKKPFRPPIPKSPSLTSKEKPPPPAKITTTNSIAPMESNSPQSPPKAKPRPVPRPRANGDRPVPSPRRQVSKSESEEIELTPSKGESQSETLSLSDQLFRGKTNKQNATEDNLVYTASDKLSGGDKHNIENINPENSNVNTLNANTANGSVSPTNTLEHKVVIKQKSKSPGPYENIKKLDSTQNVTSPKRNPYENVKLNKKKEVETKQNLDNKSIYSAPQSLDCNVNNNLTKGTDKDDESLYFAPSSKPININNDDDENTGNDTYDIPSTSISPLKSHKHLTKIMSEPVKSQNRDENIYAAPTSPNMTIGGNHDLRFNKGSNVTDLKGRAKPQVPNPPTLSRISQKQKPTPMNPGTPVIPYSMLRNSVNNDQSQMDDGIVYSNLEEETLYSAPPSTPKKVPDNYIVEKPRSISQLSSNATMSPRDSMSSGSSRGSSSISENSIFIQEDTYNVPNTLRVKGDTDNTNTFIVKGDVDAMNTFRIKGDTTSDDENDENEYDSIPAATTDNANGGYRDSKYVDMSPGSFPILSPPTKPPRPSSVTKRPSSEYESIDFLPSSPTKSTGTNIHISYLSSTIFIYESTIFFSPLIRTAYSILLKSCQ